MSKEKPQSLIDFENSDVVFKTETYKDGKLMTVSLDSVDTIGFNTWAFLTSKAGFDTVVVRVATEDEIKEFYEEV